MGGGALAQRLQESRLNVSVQCTTFPPDLTLDRYKKIHTSKASKYPNFNKAPYQSESE